jgi:hypothetical protein
MPLIQPSESYPSLGCDPEFFFTKKGKVIGSELVIPEDGLKVGQLVTIKDNRQKIIRDGVQAELNPYPNSCRDILASNIRQLLTTINGEILTKDAKKELGISFNQLVRVSKPHMRKLSEKSRRFGCSPSKSIYGESIDIGSINTDVYLYRAAGGHIHLGINGAGKKDGLYRALKTDVERTVYMLDIICGNTLVLVDRDKGNIERRKVYGRAGEYRTPEHGIEYRTPSNFWLQSKPLLSLTFGLARLVVDIMADTKHEDYYKAFTEVVKPEEIQMAINTNNSFLAMKNFKAIVPLLKDVTNTLNIGRNPLNKGNLDYFYFFVDMVAKKGLSFWFPEKPLDHWMTGHSGKYYRGFNEFLLQEVGPIVNSARNAGK